jgi:hypothetical protein
VTGCFVIFPLVAFPPCGLGAGSGLTVLMIAEGFFGVGFVRDVTVSQRRSARSCGVEFSTCVEGLCGFREEELKSRPSIFLIFEEGALLTSADLSVDSLGDSRNSDENLLSILPTLTAEGPVPRGWDIDLESEVRRGGKSVRKDS